MDKRVQAPVNVHFHNLHPSVGDSRSEILQGLQGKRKTINPKWFYNKAGSALFEQITRLPEYYPTRTEIRILQENRQEISARCGHGCVLMEPGSGNCEKARLLLDTLQPAAYAPLDISAGFLEEAATRLGNEYPWLKVHAVCADFNDGWPCEEALPAGKRVVFYPGSTIGNLEPESARKFLCRVRKLIGDEGGLLIGVDLHKSEARLNAAYNDGAGVTARFNLNVLNHVNQLLDAEFDEAQFSHRAFYNRDHRRIEMHLVSEQAQSVRCGGEDIAFASGETIHTENSYKYTVKDFAELAGTAGLTLAQSWLDPDRLFSVHYLESAG
ncbi:L-histidine N(alpha)-methyltransferase [Biformimicrobium ophioploci]|uniref:L-histidine N(Alpha)-methyltransferase n=1 Tax=Biformimicrobium ophioploci TaxID=3036711 RepID=A0ABQ6LXF4_9GAMM|nr:L-histidine N(alpha)-methyltransferase [Microbulbifer sp. NKW57]GMG86755.1 L-histidine N(alpha)-methyltransferase [Microbulbifer sp. NKW57]